MAIFNKFKMEALKGSIDLSSDTIKVMLMSSAYTPNISTDLFVSNISAYQIKAPGYTAGGKTIANAIVIQDNADNDGVFDGDDVTWSNSSIKARYAVVYKDSGTPGTSPLISFIDFGADRSSLNEAFTISWNAEGIIKSN